MSEWISVKDRLPNGGEVVLACDPVKENMQIIFGSQLRRRVNETSSERFYRSKPTHWQPLPEPPPKPDAFEEWWETLERFEGNPAVRWVSKDYLKMWKGQAKAAWCAVIASTNKV